MKPALIALGALLLYGCASRPERPDAYYPPSQPVSAGSYVNWRQFGLSLNTASSVYVYEGTPRDFDIKKRDLKRPTVTIDGFEFYADARKLDSAKVEAINTLIRDRTVFLDYRGMKLCGGFHPNYCIEWRFEAEHQTWHSRAFACLGCHEWRLLDHASALHADMAGLAVSKLISILEK